MKANIKNEILFDIGRVADSIGYKAYVIGGYVRDYLLGIDSNDIDIVVLGQGKKMAESFAKEMGSNKISIFENFGTAMVKVDNNEIEFVGARKESYNRGSRKPIVESGTLKEDQMRRDFTINAIGICLNHNEFGEIIDPFNGINDLKNKIIRTPTNPNVTFSDDPLRQLRAIRFATKLGFEIEEDTINAIKHNAYRINIVSKERIAVELNKILQSDTPSIGIKLLYKTGLLNLIIPELCKLDSNGTNNIIIYHKNIFYHTLQVLDSVSSKTDNLWLRWAALLHDIGKIETRKFDGNNWTFLNHEVKGAEIAENIFKRLKLPLGNELKYVKKMILLHMRPQILSNLTNITDSAVRRIVFDADGDIEDLLTLCESDITTHKEEKKERFLENYKKLKYRIRILAKKDFVREFQPCVTGNDIMRIFNLPPCPKVGEYKKILKEAVLDGIVPNSYNDLISFLKKNL